MAVSSSRRELKCQTKHVFFLDESTRSHCNANKNLLSLKNYASEPGVQYEMILWVFFSDEYNSLNQFLK